MKFWVDAQLPPSLANWLSETFQVEATSLRERGLRDSNDREIFDAAKLHDAVIISKDSDFVDLITRLGSPPRLLWVTCGNVTNRKLKEHFQSSFPKALQMLQDGESIVEIREAQ